MSFRDVQQEEMEVKMNDLKADITQLRLEKTELIAKVHAYVHIVSIRPLVVSDLDSGTSDTLR